MALVWVALIRWVKEREREYVKERVCVWIWQSASVFIVLVESSEGNAVATFPRTVCDEQEKVVRESD